VEMLVDGSKYRLPGAEAPQLSGTELRRHRARGPTLRSLVRLALQCDSAEQMGKQLKRRYDRNLRRRGMFLATFPDQNPSWPKCEKWLRCRGFRWWVERIELPTFGSQNACSYDCRPRSRSHCPMSKLPPRGLRSLFRTSARSPLARYAFGWTFWFSRNRLSGSYLAFSAASRV
jgi:hypothetical protein